VRAAPISGAMYAMLDVRATGMSGEDFANALLDAELIGVMPGESFGAGGAGHIRVAMTVADDLLADALRRIASFAGTLVR
jgi:arginine:pyruvate transaminase